MKNLTINDIANKTGVSKSTVSRVLSNDPHVSEQAREKVNAVVRQLGFQPNYFAKGMKTKRSKTIAFFVPNVEIMVYPTIIQAIEAEIFNRGYTLLLCDIQENKKMALDYVRNLKGRSIDGFIFSTALSDASENKEIEEVISSGIPCINLLRSSKQNISNVVFDNANGSKMGVEYLLSKGKKKIAYLQGQEELNLYADRKKGYVQALISNGLSVDEKLIWSGYKGKERIAQQTVFDKLKNGLEVDAIFCASDNIAIDTLHAIHKMGLRVPEDVSVLGYDNVPILELIIPRLTAISQPFKDMGKKAVSVLIDMIEGVIPNEPKDYIFEPSLVEGDTVK